LFLKSVLSGNSLPHNRQEKWKKIFQLISDCRSRVKLIELPLTNYFLSVNKYVKSFRFKCEARAAFLGGPLASDAVDKIKRMSDSIDRDTGDRGNIHFLKDPASCIFYFPVLLTPKLARPVGLL
jgi:hypothetical protein